MDCAVIISIIIFNNLKSEEYRLNEFLQQTIFGPLKMKDTGYHASEADLKRLAYLTPKIRYTRISPNQPGYSAGVRAPYRRQRITPTLLKCSSTVVNWREYGY